MLWKVQTGDSIDWRVSPKVPSDVPISAFPGWHLLTPIGQLQSGKALEDARLSAAGEVCTSERVIYLRGPASENTFERVMQISNWALNALKFVASHPLLPTTGIAYSNDKPSAALELPACDTGRVVIRDYVRTNAIRDAELTAFTNLRSDFEVPVHAEVILDAIGACIVGDYRKALLYGAIACETYALGKLSNALDTVLADKKPEHRVIELIIAGKNKAVKDPIYEALARGDDFGRLLHERPLYLLGRSLLIEDEGQYKKARMLYRTRNKLSHHGNVGGEDSFALTADGATRGLAAAVFVLRWYGDDGNYHVPRGFVDDATGKAEGSTYLR